MDEKKIKSPDHITFEYTYSLDHKIIYANGAFGGPTGKGDIRISFFIETPKVPNSETFILDDKGLGEKIDIKSESTYPIRTREFQISILLSIDNAETIAKWLTEQVNKWKNTLKTAEN
jgi:hypothetical protein